MDADGTRVYCLSIPCHDFFMDARMVCLFVCPFIPVSCVLPVIYSFLQLIIGHVLVFLSVYQSSQVSVTVTGSGNRTRGSASRIDDQLTDRVSSPAETGFLKTMAG